MACTLDAVTKAMARYIGIGETPPGSNINAITQRAGMPGAPWCDLTVSEAGDDAGGRDIIGFFAYTPSHAKWFDAQGLFVLGTEGIQAGDIVFFHFGDPTYGGRWNGIHHVGLCTGTHADGRVATIEGNTDDDCQPRLRSRSLIAGYARPLYTPAPKQVPATPAPSGKPTKPAPKVVRPTLYKDVHKKWWVRFLQERLNAVGAKDDAGHRLKPDGDFGRLTKQAVENFQRGHHLAVDGVVGKDTWAKLG